MATYKFEMFNAEITDPEITIHRETVGIDLTTKTVSVSITLKTPQSKLYGLRLTEMPLYDPSLDKNDIEVLVNNRLKDFEVQS